MDDSKIARARGRITINNRPRAWTNQKSPTRVDESKIAHDTDSPRGDSRAAFGRAAIHSAHRARAMDPGARVDGDLDSAKTAIGTGGEGSMARRDARAVEGGSANDVRRLAADAAGGGTDARARALHAAREGKSTRVKRPSERGEAWAKRAKTGGRASASAEARDGAKAGWLRPPTKRGEMFLGPTQVAKLAGKLPYGCEFAGMDGPIAHVSRDGALYGNSEEELRRWQAHNVSTLGVVDDFVPDFGLGEGVIGVTSKKRGKKKAGGGMMMPVPLTVDPFAGLMTGLLVQPPSRPSSRGPATQSKRAMAEERAQKMELRKRLTELDHLLNTLTVRAYALTEQRDELSLISQRANAALSEIDSKRKATSVSRGISAMRQKLGCKPDTQVGFDTLRYRALLEVVHKQCLTSVRQLIAHKWGFPFAAPVDPDALDLPTYREIIKEPMDLGTVKNLIENGGKYVKAEEVDADVRLTFANAMKFNAEGTDVHAMAKELLVEWETRWATIQQRIADVEACCVIERKAAEAKNEAASRRADVVSKEKECSKASEAIDLVNIQLGEVQNQVLALMRPLERDDRLNLASELRSLPEGLRVGAREIIAANTTGWKPAAHLEDVDAHNDLTIHLLARYTKTMNRNRLAINAGWCGVGAPKHLLARFKEEPMDASGDTAMANFMIGHPIDEVTSEVGLRSIDAMPDELDFDPVAFDDLLGDVSVDVDGMDMGFDL